MAFDFQNGGHNRRTEPSSSDTNIFRKPSGNREVPISGGTSQTGGFKNRPVQKKEQRFGWDNYTNGKDSMWSNTSEYRKPRKRNWQADSVDFSMKTVFILCAAVLAIILCVVFRDAITDFLTMVLAWVIVVVVIILLIRLFIFRKKRR